MPPLLPRWLGFRDTILGVWLGSFVMLLGKPPVAGPFPFTASTPAQMGGAGCASNGQTPRGRDFLCRAFWNEIGDDLVVGIPL